MSSTKKRKLQPDDDASDEIEVQTDEDLALECTLLYLQRYFKPYDTVGIGTSPSFPAQTLIASIRSVLDDYNLVTTQDGVQKDAIIMFCGEKGAHNWGKEKVDHLVRKGGLILLVVLTIHQENVENVYLSTNDWHGVDTQPCNQYTVFCFRRNGATCVNNRPMGPVMLDRLLNLDRETTVTTSSTATSAATSTSTATSTTNLPRETEILNMITVSLNAKEREEGLIDQTSHSKIVESMEEHGMCIIEGLFQATSLDTWGKNVNEDVTQIVKALQDNHNIDILDPKQAEALSTNFVEISTRDQNRFDVRKGDNLSRLNQHFDNVHDKCHEISRYHPSLLNIVKDLFNPMSPHYDGNWGKYNFEGNGIGSIPEPIVSPIGCVVSDPGATSQKIHADTPHLLENLHMPSHYINCFLPIVKDPTDLTVGQTAFFIGTHKLDASADVIRSIQTSNGQNVDELKSRLIRPHLNTGDFLLFDTVRHFCCALSNEDFITHFSCVVFFFFFLQRIFHFGLPNTSSSTRRCILYINFTQHWFARQRTDKNWGKISCFEPALGKNVETE